jgi:hypothetical protein
MGWTGSRSDRVVVVKNAGLPDHPTTTAAEQSSRSTWLEDQRTRPQVGCQLGRLILARTLGICSTPAAQNKSSQANHRKNGYIHGVLASDGWLAQSCSKLEGMDLDCLDVLKATASICFAKHESRPASRTQRFCCWRIVAHTTIAASQQTNHTPAAAHVSVLHQPAWRWSPSVLPNSRMPRWSMAAARTPGFIFVIIQRIAGLLFRLQIQHQQQAVELQQSHRHRTQSSLVTSHVSLTETIVGRGSAQGRCFSSRAVARRQQAGAYSCRR